MKNTIPHLEAVNFKHKIGSTIYHVNVHYNKNSKELFQDKVFRMIKNDLKNCVVGGKINPPQADWLSERG